MSSTALQIVTALDVLLKSALTAAQISEILSKPDFTVHDVEEALARVDDAIQRARDEN